MYHRRILKYPSGINQECKVSPYGLWLPYRCSRQKCLLYHDTKFNLNSKVMDTQELERRIESGAKFRISFEKRALYVNGKSVDLSEGIDTEFSFEKLENLYRRYKHSLPGERDQVKKSYFIALDEEDLSDEDVLYGERRQLAKFRLEFYVLCAIVSGALTWNEDWGSYFWQSENDKSLVILRSWIEP